MQSRHQTVPVRILCIGILVCVLASSMCALPRAQGATTQHRAVSSQTERPAPQQAQGTVEHEDTDVEVVHHEQEHEHEGQVETIHGDGGDGDGRKGKFAIDKLDQLDDKTKTAAEERADAEAQIADRNGAPEAGARVIEDETGDDEDEEGEHRADDGDDDDEEEDGSRIVDKHADDDIGQNAAAKAKAQDTAAAKAAASASTSLDDSTDFPTRQDHIVNAMLNSGRAASRASGDGAKTLRVKNAHVVMQNKNEVQRLGSDDDEESQSQRVARIKEMGVKKGQEEEQKMERRTRMERQQLDTSTQTLAERQEDFQQLIRHRSEQASKRQMDHVNRMNEAAAKSMDESHAKLRAASRRLKRQQQIQATKTRIAREKIDSAQELKRKSLREELQKKDHAAKLKLREHTRKKIREQKRKSMIEQAKKHQVRLKDQQKQETKRKRRKRILHRQKVLGKARARAVERKHKRAAERARKARERNAPARWCGCMTMSSNFGSANRWAICPGGRLIVGFHRKKSNNLDSLSAFHCCRPCKPNGVVMNVNNCQVANWVHSFDRRGLSKCPPGKYIQGLYRSSCNHIYCIEYARCCSIAGSRGSRRCHSNKKWWGSFDRPGWSWLTRHTFLRGLWRNRCNRLYCIEEAHECEAFAG
jgi:hypothetical protein